MTRKAAPPPEMIAIRDAAQRLAVANRALTARAELQQRELDEVVAPIIARHRNGLDDAAQERAACHAELMRLVEAAPQLFQKPRSVTVDGVKVGYRKEEDALDWGDEECVISRIENMLPELYDLLVREKKSLVADALAQLEVRQLRKIGINFITGADRPFVTIGTSDLEKMVQAILADAVRRTGEDEKPKKKGKAEAKPRSRELA